MIYLEFETEKFKYEIIDVIKLFYKENEIKVISTEPPSPHGGIFLKSSLYDEKAVVLVLEIKMGENYKPPSFKSNINGSCTMKLGCSTRMTIPLVEKNGCNNEYETLKITKREIKRGIYKILSDYTGKNLPWGILTGIRPSKIVHEMLEDGQQRKEILTKLNEYYLVSMKKAELLFNTAMVERNILNKTYNDTVSIYIGIPFCKTRCIYCSFTSNQIDKNIHLVNGYFNALKKEILHISEFVRERELKIQSIYIGGGTPTSVDSVVLEELLEFIESSFDVNTVEEYTLEAGRPDSIDAEKLNIIKNSKVSRISINPQTMNDKTLTLIGRKHSSFDIIQAFKLARKLGFNNINMDVIVGLPGEDLSMFEKTMKEISELDPESITVHTLAIKKASKLKEGNVIYDMISDDCVTNMLDLADEYSAEMSMHSYYLYRQKNILGNLENVGYCKPGKESIYNIQIMEEKQTIIALGAGAITKVIYPSGNRIERSFNVKNVEEYISRIDEMIDRKSVLLKTI